MFVSVIIPAYNAEKTLAYCLESCIKQIENIKEIIVIDDHSLDSTLEIARNYQSKFEDKIIIRKNIGKGSNVARNFGFSLSTGKYIQWLDADDEICEGKLASQLLFLESNTHYDIAYSDWELRCIDKTKKCSVEFKKEFHTNDFLLKLLLDNWLPPHAYLLNRNAAFKLNTFKAWNPNTIVLQDREYYTIAALIGLRFGFAEGNFAIYYRYLDRKSLSKTNSIIRYKSLYNLTIRIFQFIETHLQYKLNNKQFNALVSNKLLSEFMLQLPFSNRINLYKICWSIFPGKIVKLEFLKRYLLR